MNFTEVQMPKEFSGMRLWRCRKGFWSFTIATDPSEKEGLHFCTYRDMRIPIADKITKKSAMQFSSMTMKSFSTATHQIALDIKVSPRR